MRIIAKLLVAGAALLAAPITNAIPVTYTFDGTCTVNCSNIGLSTGGAVGGYITAGDGFDSDGLLYASELTDFNLDFGTVHVTKGSFLALGGFGLNPDLSFNTTLGGITFQSLFSGATTGSLFSVSGWTARVGLKGAGGPGSYTPNAVPEPSALALLGIGLLGIGIAQRRRQA